MRRNRNRLVATGALVAATAAAIVIAVVSTTGGGGSSSVQAPAASAATYQPVNHVVLVMEENKAESATYGHMPYLDSIANKYAVATNYWATNYPSEPNYMTLTSGHPVPGKDCSPSSSCQSAYDNIFHQLSGVEGGWRVLAESMPSNCAKSNSGEYVPRHTAAPYYTDIATPCKTLDVPYSSGATPNVSSGFTLIAPNLLHDMHDGTIAAGDSWLKTVLPKILGQSQFTDGSTLVEVAWDSGSSNCGASCQSHVELALANPRFAGLKLGTKYTHCSLLRLNEELLNLPLLGCAASAPDMRGALGL